MNPNQKNKGKKKFTNEEHKQWSSGFLFGVVRYTLAIQKYVSYNTKYTLIVWFGDGITTRLMGNEFATLTTWRRIKSAQPWMPYTYSLAWAVTRSLEPYVFPHNMWVKMGGQILHLWKVNDHFPKQFYLLGKSEGGSPCGNSIYAAEAIGEKIQNAGVLHFQMPTEGEQIYTKYGRLT